MKRVFRVRHDSHAGALYITLRKGTISRTDSIANDVLIDFDENGSVIGIELLRLEKLRRSVEDALEDVEALTSDRFRQSIARARAEAKRGDVVPFEEVLREHT